MAITNPLFKTSLYVAGSLHAVRLGDDCYITQFMTSLGFATIPPMAPMPNGGDTFAIAVKTSDGSFIVDTLNNFQILDTP